MSLSDLCKQGAIDSNPIVLDDSDDDVAILNQTNPDDRVIVDCCEEDVLVMPPEAVEKLLTPAKHQFPAVTQSEQIVVSVDNTNSESSLPSGVESNGVFDPPAVEDTLIENTPLHNTLTETEEATSTGKRENDVEDTTPSKRICV